MRLAVSVLGTEVLAVEIGTSRLDTADRGDCTTQPIGFAPSLPVQRWDRGPDLDRA